jgi:hypothetical protein
VLALSAVLLYAYLSIGYERFYGSLGVDPGAVGLSYTGVLARSSGFVLAFLLAVVIGAGGPLSLHRDIQRERRKNPTALPRPGLPRPVLIAIFLITIVLIGTLTVPMLNAGDAARDVKAGKPVGPIRFPGPPWVPLPTLPLPVLAIHAAPATVEPAGKPGDSPAAERLQGRKVLYLGQAGGVVVLYDPSAQQVIYIPAGSVFLHVSNCNSTHSTDPACAQYQLY